MVKFYDFQTSWFTWFVLAECLFFSVTRRSRSDVSESVSEETLRIDLADVTLMIPWEDFTDDDYDDDDDDDDNFELTMMINSDDDDNDFQ